jgi:membrane protein implicated in regulation of membrane protease activity
MPLIALIVVVCALLLAPLCILCAMAATIMIVKALLYFVVAGCFAIPVAALLIWLDPRERRNREYRRQRDAKLLNDARSNLLGCMESHVELRAKEHGPQAS